MFTWLQKGEGMEQQSMTYYTWLGLVLASARFLHTSQGGTPWVQWLAQASESRELAGRRSKATLGACGLFPHVLDGSHQQSLIFNRYTFCFDSMLRDEDKPWNRRACAPVETIRCCAAVTLTHILLVTVSVGLLKETKDKSRGMRWSWLSMGLPSQQL